MAILCGLQVESSEDQSTPVPLTGVSVRVRILDLIAEVNVEQRYVNRENNPIEAVYKFPLDEGAAVCKFTAEVDGRFIEGVVKEAEVAEKEYAEAIQTGHSAFLVEEKLPDIFKARVGNLGPGSGAKINLTYTTELKVEGGKVRFYLPTTIAPRYIAAQDTSRAAADLASMTHALQVDYRLEFKAEVKMGSNIVKISSPTHTINSNVNSGTRSAEVHLQDVTVMDRDLVLYIEVAEPHEPRLFAEKSGTGSKALLLSVVPSFRLKEQPVELIFVVDRSGSMQGDGIAQAKQALQIFLHSLPINCYVNIVGFGFTHSSLFPSSRKYDDEVLSLSKIHAQALEADMGGTEIYDPLEWIFQQPPIEGYLRQVFLLTDGEVSNAEQVIKLVHQNNSKARVFALGLGSSASHYLVEGIARAGNGTALFASLDERLEHKVLQQLQDALHPAMTDVMVTWGNSTGQPTVEQAAVQTELTLVGFGKPLTSDKEKENLRQMPSKCPPVFDGKHLAVYALLDDKTPLPPSVTVTATSPVGPLKVTVPLNESECLEGEMIHKLAAKKRITELQDTRSGDDDAKQEIIQLGCRFGLTSMYTSYLAIDSKAQTTLKDSWIAVKSREVPVNLAFGWGGLSQPLGYSCMPLARFQSLAVPAACVMDVTVGSFAPNQYRSMAKRGIASPESFPMPSYDCRSDTTDDETCALESTDSIPECSTFNVDSLMMDSVAPVVAETDDDKLLKLLSLQSFDGHFNLNSTLAELLGSTTEEIVQSGQLLGFSKEVWGTLLAVSFMHNVLMNLKDSWILVASKAERWLQSQNLTDEVKAKEEANQFVKSKLNG